MGSTSGLRLPVQSQPVTRGTQAAQGHEGGVGVEAAQTVCDGLTGLAQQMCYAVALGVNM
jgi:hypothetical protein